MLTMQFPTETCIDRKVDVCYVLLRLNGGGTHQNRYDIDMDVVFAKLSHLLNFVWPEKISE